MQRTVALLGFGLLLAGCASGTILKSQVGSEAGVALLSSPAGTVTHVAPLHWPGRSVRIAPVDPLALAVTAGWYKVSFSCDARYENGEVVEIFMREYTTERNIRVRAGHKYQLTCSPKEMGVLHVQDLGLAPNNSFKPKPLRGSA